jgi:hypothetical protein
VQFRQADQHIGLVVVQCNSAAPASEAEVFSSADLIEGLLFISINYQVIAVI